MHEHAAATCASPHGGVKGASQQAVGVDVGQPLVGNSLVFVDFLSVLVRVVFLVAILVGIGSGLGWAAARTVAAVQRSSMREWSCMMEVMYVLSL